MDIPLTYYGSVKDGKILLPRKKFQEEVTRQFEGKRIEVTVQKKKRKRSNEQNKYYRGVVIPILAYTFKEWNKDIEITNEIVHNWAKDRFLPMVTDWEDLIIKTPEGEKEMTKTTTRLSTVQFMDYIALIQQWAAEFGIYIPDPNEFEFEGAKEVNIDSY